MPNKKIFTDEQIKSIIFDYVNTSLSTRDIAKQFCCACNTINKLLKENNVNVAGSSKISAKMVGKKTRLGAKHSCETKALMSEIRKGKKSTTLGKVYTAQEKINISLGVKNSFALRPLKKHLEARAIGLENIKKARNKCKSLLRRVLNLTGTKKVTKTYDTLGYTEKDLIVHLEKNFKTGMNWSDRNSFHIDHIVPVTWFIKNGITDPKIINALDNLQPLYPKENMKKSDSFDPKQRNQTLRALFDHRGKATYTAFV